jgi:hypothetical protein
VNDDLRHRYAEAIRGCGPLSVTKVLYAVMAVRDNELEQLKEDALAVVAESAQEVQAWRERAEKAEAAIARVRRLAEEWAELAERGDESAASLDRAVADSGRDLLAALDDSQETDHGER